MNARMPPEAPAAALALLRRLPAFADTVRGVLAVVDDPNADTDAIAAAVGRDQGLSATVLRLANSAFYAQRGRVGNLRHGVILLGGRTIRTLAVASAVAGRLLGQGELGKALRRSWRHSILVAAACRVLAARCAVDRDDAFTAGLLHEIGRLALAECFPRAYEPVLALRIADEREELVEERLAMGIDHAQAGAFLAEHWNFPEAIHDAIGDQFDDETDSPHPLASVLRVAHGVCAGLDSTRPMRETTGPADRAAQQMGLVDLDPTVLAAEVREGEKALAAALGVA